MSGLQGLSETPGDAKGTKEANSTNAGCTYLSTRRLRRIAHKCFVIAHRRKPHLQGRFSGRLATKDDERRLAVECKMLGPLLGGVGKRGDKSL